MSRKNAAPWGARLSAAETSSERGRRIEHIPTIASDETTRRRTPRRIVWTPLVYLVSDVAELLNRTDWSIYEQIKRDEIPGVFMLGTKIRIDKECFNREFRIPNVSRPGEKA